jgi:hypothetical protein
VSSHDWRDLPIGRAHDRNRFDCGDVALNTYLTRYARQNHESGGAKTFVAVTAEQPTAILGFYTLSPASLEYTRTPGTARKGLGRYDTRLSARSARGRSRYARPRAWWTAFGSGGTTVHDRCGRGRRCQLTD